MRNLLAFLAALALTFAGVGWYLDWFKIRSAPPVEEPGHRSVNIDINTKKVGQDLHRAEEKVQDALNSSKEDPAKRAATQAINTAKEVGN